MDFKGTRRWLMILSSPARRLREYGGTGSRLVGIDVARGLAVIGMLGAHVLIVDPWDWAQPGTWLDIVNGRSAILFAILAGVSLAIISGRRVLVERVDLLKVRVRIFVRAAGIFLAGGILESIATGFPIILGTYAVAFIAALACLRFSVRRLLVAASIILSISPIVVHAAREARAIQSGEFLSGYFVELMVTGEFAAIYWIGFVLLGLALGRMRIETTNTQILFVATGIGAAIIGYQVSEAALRVIDSAALDPDLAESLYLLADSTPHAVTATEALGGGGIAVATIGACLVITRVRSIRWLLLPAAAVGSMALTAYVGHFVAILLLGEWASYTTDPGVFVAFALWMMVLCSLWWIVIGKGPLEQMLTAVARAASRIDGEREHSPAPTRRPRREPVAPN